MLSHDPATICEGQDEAGAADHLGSPEVSNAVDSAFLAMIELRAD